MFYNFSFLPHLLLFMLFLVATFNGMIAIRTRALEPAGLSGSAAVNAGYGLVAVGIASLAGIFLLLVYA